MSKLRTPQDVVDSIIRLKLAGKSSRDIAEELLGSRSKKSTVNDIYNSWLSNSNEYTQEYDDKDNKDSDTLADSGDWAVGNLAKRLRSAQRTNNQLRKIHRQTVDPLEELDEMLSGIKLAVKQINKPATHNTNCTETKGLCPATLEILISDLQVGKIGQAYNTEIAKRAMKKYGAKILEAISNSNYNFERIVIAIIGDLVEDDQKHGVQSANSTDSGLAQQIADATEMLWKDIIKPVGKLGLDTEVICIAGNHGSSQHKGMDMYKAGLFSYDFPIFKALECLCSEVGLGNVKFNIPEGVFAYTDFYGNIAVYEHGYFNTSTEKSMADQRQKRGNQIKKHVEYFRVGDMHHVVSYDCHKMVVNGAFFGVDSCGVEYSGILGFNSIPAQVMMIHTKEDNIGMNTIKEFITVQLAG